MSEQQKAALVPVDLFNKITEYLVNKPYVEVQHLIEGLRSQVNLVNTQSEDEQQPEEPSDD